MRDGGGVGAENVGEKLLEEKKIVGNVGEKLLEETKIWVGEGESKD